MVAVLAWLSHSFPVLTLNGTSGVPKARAANPYLREADCSPSEGNSGISGRLVRSPEYVFDLGTTVARGWKIFPFWWTTLSAIVLVRPNAW